MALLGSAEAELEAYRGVKHVFHKKAFVQFVGCIDSSRGSLGFAGLRVVASILTARDPKTCTGLDRCEE